jgi:hypothetical protein
VCLGSPLGWTVISAVRVSSPTFKLRGFPRAQLTTVWYRETRCRCVSLEGVTVRSYGMVRLACSVRSSVLFSEVPFLVPFLPANPVNHLVNPGADARNPSQVRPVVVGVPTEPHGVEAAGPPIRSGR